MSDLTTSPSDRSHMNLSRMTVLKQCDRCFSDVTTSDLVHGEDGSSPCGGTLITVCFVNEVRITDTSRKGESWKFHSHTKSPSDIG